MELDIDALRSRMLHMALLLTGSACLIRQIQKNNGIKKQRRRRRWWVRPIYNRKYQHSDYYNLYPELRNEDSGLFFNYTRMTKDMFDELLSLIGPSLKKRSNRPTIPPECRLLITLRLLASGDSLQSVAFAYRMGKSTVCNILRETCGKLWDVLQPLYLSPPNKQKWSDISKEFCQKWQFPNCVGAIDGKHINIKQPNKSGSCYFNYKKNFSNNLFAVCDAKYKFTVVEIGGYGSESDGGILRQSEFGQALNRNELDIPPDEVLPGTSESFPYFFVGDDAFPLQKNLLKPYPGKYLIENLRIYNYRLSRARRCIENAFGILAARWRIFHKTIHAFPETVDKIVQATTCLHNFIMVKQEELQQNFYCHSTFIDREVNNQLIPGQWREEISNTSAIQSIERRLGTRNARQDALQCRERYMRYVKKEKRVPWQKDYVNKCK